MAKDLFNAAPLNTEGERTGSFRSSRPTTPEEDAALEALLAASSKVQGALNKSPTLLAKYSDPKDILATVGADGQLSISAVGKLNEANVEIVQNRDSDLKSRMAAISTTMDLRERQDLLSSFQADFAEQLSKDIQKHKAIADSQSGVPQLRAQLIAAEARDQRDPLYYKYQSDSTPTARVRAALMQAENHSRAVTKDRVAQDPYLNKNHALVTNFIDTENKNIARLLQKSEATDMQVEQETAGLTATNLAAIAAEYPDKTVEELKRIAYGLKTNPVTRRDYAAVLDPAATPEDYAVAYVAGMKQVQPYVIQEQSRRTGQSPEQVRNELRQLQSLVRNDLDLFEVVRKVGSTEEKKQFGELLAKQKTAKGKEATEEWRKIKLDWVMSLTQNMAANRINGDARNWPALNGIALKDIPEIKAIIDRYAVAGKPVGINELIDTFVTAVPKEQQAERFKLIKDHYAAAIDNNNKGLYGIIKKDSAMKALEARFVGTGFFNSLMNAAVDTFGTAGRIVMDAKTGEYLPSKANIDLSAIKVSKWLEEQGKSSESTVSASGMIKKSLPDNAVIDDRNE